MIKGYSPKTGVMLTIDKPVDWTSFDVVNKIRRITGIKKVGHAGTLDPFATGVLVICLGPATKQSGDLMNLPKEYIAEIELGRETDTMDVTGKTILEKEVPTLTQSAIEATFDALTGEVEQEVPAYSAAKIKGKRMYKLAREGKEMPQVFKKVTIEAIDLLDFSEKAIRIRVLCGRGTYIRTLGRDIARALNTAGFLKTLVRTRIGDFRIENAQSIEEFQEQLIKSTEIVSD